MASALDWDEFRLIKAIADARSLVGAAEALNLNHSTVFRRLAAIENDVGARLFERSRAGYQPTEAGEEMIALAGTMAESILEFERRVAGRDAKPSGELRVTTVDSVAVGLLAPILARFRAANPGVQVDLIIAAQTLNLSRRDADVAIRGANDPPESLVGRRICTIRWAVYCTPAMAAEFGGRVVAAAPWVGFSSAPTRGKRWIDEKIGPRRQVCAVNSVLAMAANGRRGARRDGAAVFRRRPEPRPRPRRRDHPRPRRRPVAVDPRRSAPFGARARLHRFRRRRTRLRARPDRGRRCGRSGLTREARTRPGDGAASARASSPTPRRRSDGAP